MKDRIITIQNKEGQRRASRVVSSYRAVFSPRRKLSDYEIGWATVETDDVTLRFPVIVHSSFGSVMRVRDWQAAEWSQTSVADPIDLADPDAITDMLRFPSSSFVTPTGNPTGIAERFTAPHRTRG